jgi:two-component system chemotaxis sensor kinase CheA
MSMDLKLYQMLLETFSVELQEIHQSLVTGLLSLEKATSNDTLEETLQQLFRFAHNLKGAAASASVTSVTTIAHRLEDLFSEWKKNLHFPDAKQISACLAVVDNLSNAFKDQCENKEVDVALYLAPFSSSKSVAQTTEEMLNDEFVKIPISRIERASAKANEFITYQLKLVNWFKDLDYIRLKISQLKDEQANIASLTKTFSGISSASEQFLGEFTRSVHALQNELKAMRMLPISTILLPLTRTVRNVAMALNKSVELHINGGEIELDKAILDAIKDPLQHLVRNAIDHGIETDAKRKKLKKPIPAKLIIRIKQVSGKVTLSITDDGQGIEAEKIKEHMITTHLYKKDEINEWDEQQILDCIFQPGFSMQEKVTEISGRGVGLDVVKNNIQKIKGSITVETTVGKGSTFLLTLPLTLATTRGIFFKINNQVFMLPTLSLNGLYTINPNDLSIVDNQSIWVINKVPVAVKVVSHLLKIDTILDINRVYCGLLIDYHAKQLILLVDSIVDEHDCVVNPLPFPYTQLPQFIGVTLTGENDLALVLDPAKLMEMALAEGAGELNKFHQIDELTSPKKRILVVDDSVTTRTLCSSAVETAGHEAISTFNGKKAWEILNNTPIDCVITDILMPEMDGFELTSRIKNNKKLAHIPVIIVSLLDSKESKQRGLEVGANAFIVKSEFDTHSLIQIMESLL